MGIPEGRGSNLGFKPLPSLSSTFRRLTSWVIFVLYTMICDFHLIFLCLYLYDIVLSHYHFKLDSLREHPVLRMPRPETLGNTHTRRIHGCKPRGCCILCGKGCPQRQLERMSTLHLHFFRCSPFRRLSLLVDHRQMDIAAESSQAQNIQRVDGRLN